MNVKQALINPLSWCSIPINLLNSDRSIRLASATGFLYTYQDSTYLVTNWHNFTGINPLSGRRLSPQAASPLYVEIPLRVNRTDLTEWRRYILPLYREEVPEWLIHPDWGNKVDVVALRINSMPDEIRLHHINSVNFDDQIKPEVSDDAFVIGFPDRLNSGGNFPLWKKATIASEPDIDIEGLPKILIDTASRPGMSGSPVIFTRQNNFSIYDGQLSDDSIFGQITNVLGIYSGRINTHTELDSQIGIVWKFSVIDEIISTGSKDVGYYPHHKGMS